MKDKIPLTVLILQKIMVIYHIYFQKERKELNIEEMEEEEKWHLLKKKAIKIW